MKREAKHKKVTTDDLAVMVAKGFEGISDEMGTKFASVNKHLEEIDYRLGKIESNHERNPQLKVKF